MTAAVAFCREVLPEVSRTFALNIPVLPAPLDEVVTVAYLLCRIADTVEDESSGSPADRRALLADFAALADLREDQTDGLEERARRFADRAVRGLRPGAPTSELKLLEQTPLVLRALAELPSSTWPHIARCVREMTEGMAEMAVERGEGRRPTGLPDTEATLRYCYYVAGTVGVMLTGLFADFSPKVAARREALDARAAAFGRALQLTNILKDVREDLLRGDCWLPRTVLARHGLTAQTLLEPARRAQAVAALDELVALALRETRPALEYSLALPAELPGLRLFCLWPLFFAVLTLATLRGNPAVFEPAPVKISREQVMQVMVLTRERVADDAALRSLFEELAGRPVGSSEATV